MARTTYATRIQAFLAEYPGAAPAYHDPDAERPLQRWQKSTEPCQACGSTAVTQRWGVTTRDGIKWVGRECNDVIYRHAKRSA